MTEHIETGNKGEEIALKHLRAKGYKILATNWSFGKDEIDIICQLENTLVIAEVKTRTSTYFGDPEIFVTKKKQGFLIRAANSYILKQDLDIECRFDIISIVIVNGKSRIKHIEDAFYPTL